MRLRLRMALRSRQLAMTCARKALPDCGGALFAPAVPLKCLEGVWGGEETGRRAAPTIICYFAISLFP